MANVIARVRLANGRVGFYDEATQIHLSIPRPEADIYNTMNTAGIKRAVHNKTLHLVYGSLDNGTKKVVEKDMHVKPEVKEAVEAAPVPEKVAPQKETVVKAPAKLEEVKEAEAAVEAVTVEAPVETPAEEEKPKAQARKGRQKKAEETAEETIEEKATEE